MSTPTPSIDVIVCTRDRRADLARCLRSIEIQRPLPWRVIVVIGSEDSALPDMQDRFPMLGIEVVECFDHNISIARNAGLEHAQAEIVLFLDDDAQARPGWVQAYIDAFHAKPEAWAIGGDVFDSRNAPPTIEFSHGFISASGRQIPIWDGRKASQSYLTNVKGCNFGIRRTAVMEIGGFDPFFAFAFDESDLMLSIHCAGGQVLHEPGAIVDHAHTPGHYRLADPLDRDWRVEYASHTMFMLKHASGVHRVFGRLVVCRRMAKLIVFAGWGVIQGRISVHRFAEILQSANRGIRDACRAYATRREQLGQQVSAVER